ncbi:hypothetical protein, partial [Mesorhizobium sp.]|uniref:hypothetical protein n=1 Tax=Mesorhizobium sp. TaxID=1871066 RepID=UPI0025BFBE01
SNGWCARKSNAWRAARSDFVWAFSAKSATLRRCFLFPRKCGRAICLAMSHGLAADRRKPIWARRAHPSRG